MTDQCYSHSLISINEALENIRAALSPIKDEETVNLHQALDRVLARSCIAPFNLPAFPNSSMDGYAFNSADIKNTPFTLEQVGISWAGRPFSGELSAGQCVRIFTGAVIPSGADSVIMQEQIHCSEHAIHFPENVRAKQNIRYIGEDVRQDDCLLAAPKQLSAIDLGLLASAGIYEVRVIRKIRIAFFSTGDELSAIGMPLVAGQIYDSNRYTLTALLNNPCYTITDLGVIRDDKASIHTCLLAAAKSNDVIISTGGASVGDADFIKEILDDIGQVNFWKLAIKPGKPLAFGRIQDCHFFGLPGNPISVIATFQQVVTHALRQLMGLNNNAPLRFKAVCHSQLRKQAGRQEFQRGILSQAENGAFEVISAGKQGSNILSASSRANCYIVLTREQTNVEAGTEVLVEPFSLFL
ncbi:MAG: molybdopterin molybdotransferase MoeA [Methylococcaceae bacterium]|nr:molybdopterin molybdotransferase MoeA [Methylococcaceae bacterium]